MFPVSGSYTYVAPTPTPTPNPTPDTSGYVTTAQLNAALATALPTLPVVRKACASNLTGTASLGLIQTTADYDKLYLVHGTSVTVADVDQVTQVLVGGDGLGGLGGVGGVYFVYVNGSASWPLRFRAPIDDVFEYADGTFSEDWNDTGIWPQGTLVRVERRPAGYYGSKTSWKVTSVAYTYAPTAMMNPVALRTITA